MAIHYEDDGFRLEVFVSGFSNNAWLLIDRASNKSIIIDTPDAPFDLISAAGKTDVTGILITHNHWDHLQGFSAVTKKFGVPVGIGADDAGEITKYDVAERIDTAHGFAIRAGGISLTALHTPGHTPGSTCYYLSTSGGHLFSGDTLFPGGPGKTGSAHNFSQIVDSISMHLLTLPDGVAVHPGHGDDSTVLGSRTEYEAFATRDHAADLYGEVTWQTND